MLCTVCSHKGRAAGFNTLCYGAEHTLHDNKACNPFRTNKPSAIPHSALLLPVLSMKRAVLFFPLAVLYCFFCYAVLPAQVVKLPRPVTSLSVNSNDTVLAVSDSDSISTYNTSEYTLMSDINEEYINRSLFYREQNDELLITMTNEGTFLFYGHQSGGRNAYGKIEEYMLTDYAKGKTISCNAFSKNTNYSAAAFTDFSIQIHFKLRFTQSMVTRTIEEHQSEIYGLEFSADEKYLASVSKDGVAYIWSCYNYMQAARIDNVYTRSEIPVYFTADSSYIISMDDSDSFSISDLNGQKVAGFTTDARIIALLPLSDPDKIAVLTDKNEISIYSVQRQKSIGVVRLPQTETSDITAFVFCHTENAAFVGCASGAVYKLKPRDETLRGKTTVYRLGPADETVRSEKDRRTQETPQNREEKQIETQSADTGYPQQPQKQDDQAGQEKRIQDPPLTEESTEADKSFKPALKAGKEHFLTISALAGLLQPEKTNYRYLFGVDVCYRNTYLTAPVYIGAGLRGYMALPKRPFPTQYEDFNGKTIAPPFLWMGEAYIPAGMEIVLDRNGYAVLFEELAFTARLSALSQPRVAASKSFFSYGGRVTTGISVTFFTFAVALNYDSLWKLFPEITLGGRIDFKSAPATNREAL